MVGLISLCKPFYLKRSLMYILASHGMCVCVYVRSVVLMHASIKFIGFIVRLMNCRTVQFVTVTSVGPTAPILD
jgi:hypothetical protein